MKYFLDTEFIEGFKKPLFGKRRHFIDLISIGIVDENGRSYYAVSNEYSYADADEWVKENVILAAYKSMVHGDNRNRVDASNFHLQYGRTNKRIMEDILDFMGCWRDQHFYRVGRDVPEVYGYYSDYDWVLFCSLFGRMINLPKGFPMYCVDLKQTLDAHAKFGVTRAPSSTDTFEGSLASLKRQPDYPKQTNEHNALSDAKWNFELYKFLTMKP